MKRKIVVGIILCTLMIAILGLELTSAADNSTINVIKYLPDKSNSIMELNVPYSEMSGVTFTETAEVHGPNSFFVSDNKFYIGDSYGSRISIYENNKLIDIVEYNDIYFLVDFTIIDGKYYVLDQYPEGNSSKNKVVCLNSKGEKQKEFEVPNLNPLIDPNGKNMFLPAQKIYNINGNVAIEYSGGKNYLYTNEQWTEYKEDDVSYNSDSGKRILSGKISEVEILPEGDFGEFSILNYTQDKSYVQSNEVYFDESTKIKIKEKIVYIIEENKIIKKVKLFNSETDLMPHKEVLISNDQIFQMSFDKNKNISIYRIDKDVSFVSGIISEKRNILNIFKKASYAVSNTFDGLFNTKKISASTTITRAAVEQTANTWKDYVWTYDCKRNGDSSVVVGCSLYGASCTTDHTIGVGQPTYLQSLSCSGTTCQGHNSITGVAYCWGGVPEMTRPSGSADDMLSLYYNNGPSAFQTLLNYTGSYRFYSGNTSSVPDHYWLENTAGIDCSGFTQLCFNYNEVAKIGVGHFLNDDNPFTTINSYQDARSMDILAKNTNGTHVVILDRLVWSEDFSTIIGAVVYESTTKNSIDKVSRNYWEKSYIDEFTIRRYNDIEDCSTHTWIPYAGSECIRIECSKCGKIETVSNHSWPSSWDVVTQATCASTGEIEKRCLDCHVVLDSEITPITSSNHVGGARWVTTVTPTCASTGTEEYQCYGCDYPFSSNTLPKNSSNHEGGARWVTTVTPTCASTGTEEYQCYGCDYPFNSSTIAKDSNNHVGGARWVTTVNPTCFSTGTKEYQCYGCDYPFSSQQISKTEHSWGTYIISTVANCTTTGIKTADCTNTGCVATNTIYYSDLDNHNHVNTLQSSAKTAATCPYIQNVYDYECTRCGHRLYYYTYTYQYQGHNGAWIFQYSYYDPDEGHYVYVYKRICTLCGEIEYDYI